MEKDKSVYIGTHEENKDYNVTITIGTKITVNSDALEKYIDVINDNSCVFVGMYEKNGNTISIEGFKSGITLSGVIREVDDIKAALLTYNNILTIDCIYWEA